MKLGNKIKKLREILNFTQEYVAGELQISQAAYSKKESGETEISYSELEKIANIFKIDVVDIIKFDESVVFNITMNDHSQYGGHYQPTINGDSKLFQLQEEKMKLLEDKIRLLEDKVQSITADNARLKDENEELKIRLK